mmetsp:Transcript_2033/g.5816  ORF Transcript_2033/g.5816 Transcript_2033/m.5816 type:complete len:428 (+) Transcript_2033:164-1447(+)
MSDPASSVLPVRVPLPSHNGLGTEAVVLHSGWMCGEHHFRIVHYDSWESCAQAIFRLERNASWAIVSFERTSKLCFECTLFELANRYLEPTASIWNVSHTLQHAEGAAFTAHPHTLGEMRENAKSLSPGPNSTALPSFNLTAPSVGGQLLAVAPTPLPTFSPNATHSDVDSEAFNRTESSMEASANVGAPNVTAKNALNGTAALDTLRGVVDVGEGIPFNQEPSTAPLAFLDGTAPNASSPPDSLRPGAAEAVPTSPLAEEVTASAGMEPGIGSGAKSTHAANYGEPHSHRHLMQIVVVSSATAAVFFLCCFVAVFFYRSRRAVKKQPAPVHVAESPRLRQGRSASASAFSPIQQPSGFSPNHWEHRKPPAPPTASQVPSGQPSAPSPPPEKDERKRGHRLFGRPSPKVGGRLTAKAGKDAAAPPML